mmetsp:Transcript_70491/g.178685  ORF Transcript_70491/g.178685 Transcript_70491/m.178685 type:complete len:238 (-) Transcript_70491:32-745(-)
MLMSERSAPTSNHSLNRPPPRIPAASAAACTASSILGDLVLHDHRRQDEYDVAARLHRHLVLILAEQASQVKAILVRVSNLFVCVALVDLCVALHNHAAMQLQQAFRLRRVRDRVETRLTFIHPDRLVARDSVLPHSCDRLTTALDEVCGQRVHEGGLDRTQLFVRIGVEQLDRILDAEDGSVRLDCERPCVSVLHGEAVAGETGHVFVQHPLRRLAPAPLVSGYRHGSRGGGRWGA